VFRQALKRFFLNFLLWLISVAGLLSIFMYVPEKSPWLSRLAIGYVLVLGVLSSLWRLLK
jgi:hypothetical protein